MLDGVSGIIDGRRWLAERQRHLEAELGKDLTDDERSAAEAELAQIRTEAHNHRRRAWWRLFWGVRPPRL